MSAPRSRHVMKKRVLRELVVNTAHNKSPQKTVFFSNTGQCIPNTAKATSADINFDSSQKSGKTGESRPESVGDNFRLCQSSGNRCKGANVYVNQVDLTSAADIIRATCRGSNIIKKVNVNNVRDKCTDLKKALAQQYGAFLVFFLSITWLVVDFLECVNPKRCCVKQNLIL